MTHPTTPSSPLPMDSSMDLLNSRIARLAIALGLTLQNETDVARVMGWHDPDSALSERRNSATERRSGTRSSSGADRRVAHSWAELRGLMVLRYGMHKTTADQLGLTATRKLMEDAETSMERKGFKPGEDGVDIRRMFPNA